MQGMVPFLVETIPDTEVSEDTQISFCVHYKSSDYSVFIDIFGNAVLG